MNKHDFELNYGKSIEDFVKEIALDVVSLERANYDLENTGKNYWKNERIIQDKVQDPWAGYKASITGRQLEVKPNIDKGDEPWKVREIQEKKFKGAVDPEALDPTLIYQKKVAKEEAKKDFDINQLINNSLRNYLNKQIQEKEQIDFVMKESEKLFGSDLKVKENDFGFNKINDLINNFEVLEKVIIPQIKQKVEDFRNGKWQP